MSAQVQIREGLGAITERRVAVTSDFRNLDRAVCAGTDALAGINNAASIDEAREIAQGALREIEQLIRR